MCGLFVHETEWRRPWGDGGELLAPLRGVVYGDVLVLRVGVYHHRGHVKGDASVEPVVHKGARVNGHHCAASMGNVVMVTVAVAERRDGLVKVVACGDVYELGAVGRVPSYKDTRSHGALPIGAPLRRFVRLLSENTMHRSVGRFHGLVGVHSPNREWVSYGGTDFGAG